MLNLKTMDKKDENRKIKILNIDFVKERAEQDNISEIEKLDLSKGDITTFQGGDTFSPVQLSNLKSLNISNNYLVNLSQIINLYQLENLDISGNRLYNIIGIDLLENLKCLNLDNNNLENISELRDSPKLKILSISNNKIKQLDDLIENLKSLKKLKQLKVERNPFCVKDQFYHFDIINAV